MKIALLGTGLMGYPMAERLLYAGYKVNAYNRTFKKAHPLKNFGAAVFRAPEQAVEDVNTIILMLADAKAIHEALLKPRKIFLKGKTVIQMGTIAPAESIELGKRVSRQGAEYLECPVLGSRREAKEGNLILMIGARQEQFEKWKGFLKCFGPGPQWVGEVGKAAALKLALNQMIAALVSSFALSLGFVQKQGLRVEDFMGILRKSVLYAPTFDKKLPQMLKHQYHNPNFSTRNMFKDVGLFLKEAKPKRLSTDALEGVQKILTRAMKKGFSSDDYCSLFEIINPA